MMNPDFNGEAGQIVVETYDGENKIIIDRSYSNLNPNRFTFVYPGPLISINFNKDFKVAVGTMSDFIPITLDFPAALNLTLIPFSSGFSFIPGEIKLQIGDVYNDFRISIPKGTAEKIYYITWTTVGEISPAYYTPVLRTPFHVTDDQIETVFIENIVNTPKGGTSLPVIVRLSRAPDTDLTVFLKLSDDSKGVKLSTKSLTYVDGNFEHNFTISVNLKEVSPNGKVILSINGTNASSYILDKTLIEATIYEEFTVPVIHNTYLISTSRTSAIIQVVTDRVCTLYYNWALLGTPSPIFSEMKKGGPAPFLTTRSGFGRARALSDKVANISITGLTAEARYTFYVFAEDMRGETTSNYSQINFVTDVRYKAATVKLTFSQTYLTLDDKNKAREAVALLLSLNNFRVIEETENTDTEPDSSHSPSSQNRRLRLISSSITYTIVDLPTSNNYPRPFEMINILAEKANKLGSMLSNFDSSQDISGVEIYVNPCSFAITPTISELTVNNNIIITAQLKEDGKIYATLIPVSKDPGVPYSFQVYSGHNSRNVPVLHQNVTALASKTTTVEFLDLEPSTDYNMYVICANIYPMYPELLDDIGLIKLNRKTGEMPDKRSLNLTVENYGFNLACVLTLLIII